MGKAKRVKMSKRSEARVNPTGVEVVEDEDAAEPSSEASIMQKLTSPAVEERHCACLTLANLVLEDEPAASLLDAGLVRQLGPMLVDPDRSVREAAAGALRNLSLSGNEKACDQMIAADIMTPVTALFKEAFAELKACVSSGKASASTVSKEEQIELDRLASCVEQTLHLFLNLIEASPIAVEVFNRESLLLSVMECMDASAFPEAVVLVSAQCLQAVSENNSAVSSVILSTPALLEGLRQLVASLPADESTIGLRVMLACTLSNLVPEASSELQQVLLPIVLSVLASALNADVSSALAKVSATLVGASADEPEESPEIKLINSVLSAQQTALEVFTNICNIEEDGDDAEWEDADHADEGDLDAAEEMEDISEDADGIANTASTSPLVAEHVKKALEEYQMLPKIAEKCEGIPGHIVQLLSCSKTGRSLMQRSERVQCRALTALQALSSSVAVEVIGNCDTLVQLWTMLFNAANQAGVSSDLLEALTGTLRTTALLLKQAGAPCVSAEHVGQLCQACQLPHVSVEVQVNLVATLTVLGGALLAAGQHVDALTGLAQCFVDIAARSPSVRVVCEALDGVFDVFADGGDAGDAAVEASAMLASLQRLAPNLKTKLRQGRRTLGREYPLLQSAHLNLVRFIKYMAKKKRTP